MALELLAGPFTVTNKLTDTPVGDSISGYPCWIDGRGLVLPITNDGVHVVQMDGAAYPVIDSSSLSYGLSLEEAEGRRWYGLADGFNGLECEIDDVTLYKTAQVVSGAPATLRNYARLPDRYIFPINGGINWRPLDISAGGVIECTLPGLTEAASCSWGSRSSEIVIGTKAGQVVRYNWVEKTFVGLINTIGMSCIGLWWSVRYGTYLSLHDVGTTLELRVWAATVQPNSVSNPTPDATITAGRRTRIRSRVIGAQSDPCEGEVVAWSLTGVGSLSAAASYTDSDGYAETYYEAPLDGASAEIQITAEVAI